MKLEKRSAGMPEEPDSPGATPVKEGGKKPVIIYIMILFIVAFLLMAASFAMHQRSNTEAIGELRDTASALQKVQAAQDENLRLQQELEKLSASNAALESEVADCGDTIARLQEELAGAQSRADALTALYTLQQQYAAREYEACGETIAEMERAGLDKLLPAELETDGVTTPAQRYLQLREAAEKK